MGRCFDEDAIPRVQEDLAEHPGPAGALAKTLSGVMVMPYRAVCRVIAAVDGLAWGHTQGARPVLCKDTLAGLLHLCPGATCLWQAGHSNEMTADGSIGLRSSSSGTVHALVALGVALGPESEHTFLLARELSIRRHGAWLVVRAPILLSKFYAG